MRIRIPPFPPCPHRILPHHQRLIQRIKPSPRRLPSTAGGGGGIPLPRDGRLAALRVGGRQRECVGDVPITLQRDYEAADQVEGGGLVAVAEHDVDVAAGGLAAAVASDDDHFEPGPDLVGVRKHDARDGLDLGARDGELQLVVVLDADLLDPRERVPAVLDDVVEVAPAAVVEVARRGLGDAPDVVEELEDGEFGVGFVLPRFPDLAGFAELLEEKGNLIAAAWESGYFCGALSGWVCYTGGIGYLPCAVWKL